MIESFAPVYDENARVLILGSCPSVKSLEKHEYYGNSQNRFWKIMFKLLDEPFTENYQEKKAMLLRHGIALWDVIGSCNRQGSSDSSITDEVFNDTESLLRSGKIECVALNGTKAAKSFSTNTNVKVKKLPSTSPANASKSFDELFEMWKEALIEFIK